MSSVVPSPSHSKTSLTEDIQQSFVIVILQWKSEMHWGHCQTSMMEVSRKKNNLYMFWQKGSIIGAW